MLFETETKLLMIIIITYPDINIILNLEGE